MNNHYPEKEPIISALFVDFDNIYTSLKATQNEHIARQFAQNPERWLRWLEQQAVQGHSRRRILVRKCYLNPEWYAEFRPYFIRSAFEVVDCPPVTAAGKTSTDMLLLMDALDTLVHPTNFKEFIILSGDADFRPLVLRLRMHDRWTTIFSGGNQASLAYKASCDTVISEDDFIRDGLGISLQDDEPAEAVAAAPKTSAAILEKMASKLYEATAERQGIDASDLPSIMLTVQGFTKNSQWLGYKSLRGLTEAIIKIRPELEMSPEDPWQLRRVQSTNKEEQNENLKRSIAQWIRELIPSSPSPVAMASLADGAVQKFGVEIRNSNWLGEKTFKGLLLKLDLGNLSLSSYVPGYVYDPAKHQAPGPQPGKEESGEVVEQSVLVAPAGDFSFQYPAIAPLAWKINQLTDTPYLTPEHYSLVFNEIAREINENRSYHINRTSKTVRDRCVEKGAKVARSQVNFILVGLNISWAPLAENEYVLGADLAAKMRINTINLCRNVQFMLSEAEVNLLNDWMRADLVPDAA